MYQPIQPLPSPTPAPKLHAHAPQPGFDPYTRAPCQIKFLHLQKKNTSMFGLLFRDLALTTAAGRTSFCGVPLPAAATLSWLHSGQGVARREATRIAAATVTCVPLVVAL